MRNLTAKIIFEKRVQHDNWEKGCETNSWIVSNDSFTIDFTDSEDFKNKLANWVVNNFDVNKEDFLKYAFLKYTDSELNRFDYSQNEDKEGDYIRLTEDNPDGYLCDYTFWVDKVMAEVDFKF